MPLDEKLYAACFPFWPDLSGEEKELLGRHARQQNYQAGENVHGGSGRCTGAIAVQTGSLRVYLLSGEGREVTLYRLYPGDICMLSASCVLSAITFSVFIDAEKASQCLILSGEAFARVAERNLKVKNFALETAVQRFSDVMWVMQQILFMSFDKRLAIFLEEERLRTGSNVIKLTQEQIARYTGSAREVVSRMLKYFAAEQMVEHSRQGVKILSPEKLQALISCA